MQTFHVIGLMSGTSLDGLDLAHTILHLDNSNNWSYELVHARTYPYPVELQQTLENIFDLSASNVFLLNHQLGDFYGDCVNLLIQEHGIDRSRIDAIASHGQTIFHQPEKGYTVQIGCGSSIALKTGINVINDFRTKDVILGGQGAPLVPIGDFKLFNTQAEAFLNIGGISNLSFKKDGKIVAFDCAPGNLPLNKLVAQKGLAYDENGDIARSGEINFFLLNLLDELPFYQQKGAKSLGTEWLDQQFYPLIKFDKDLENNLRTVVEHIAIQISNVLNTENIRSVFVTGGGAFNQFLIERIQAHFTGEIILPSATTIAFKEAIIFAFLGALYLVNQPNCLHEVTGASRDVCGGVLHRAT